METRFTTLCHYSDSPFRWGQTIVVNGFVTIHRGGYRDTGWYAKLDYSCRDTKDKGTMEIPLNGDGKSKAERKVYSRLLIIARGIFEKEQARQHAEMRAEKRN